MDSAMTNFAANTSNRQEGAFDNRPLSIAVAIPCLNEAASIASVVEDFRRELPHARVYVFDNGSSDNSVEIARKAGALIRIVHTRGKGRVVRAMLNELLEDIIVLVDGDSTYSAADVHRLLEPVMRGQADMAVGNRLAQPETGAITKLHGVGNRLITSIVSLLFGTPFRDVLSGFRVLNRHFTETVATLTNGFEIETELTVRALTEELRIVEIPIAYHPRPSGSQSKLRTFQDGYRILLTIGMLLRDYHPLKLFGIIGLGFFVLAGVMAVALFLGFARTDVFQIMLVLGFVGSIGTGWTAICTGLILNAINTRTRESAQLQRRYRHSHEHPDSI